MNLDLSQITAFALEGSCMPESETEAATTLTLPVPLRTRAERRTASTANWGGLDEKPWPLCVAVRAGTTTLTLTFS